MHGYYWIRIIDPLSLRLPIVIIIIPPYKDKIGCISRKTWTSWSELPLWRSINCYYECFVCLFFYSGSSDRRAVSSLLLKVRKPELRSERLRGFGSSRVHYATRPRPPSFSPCHHYTPFTIFLPFTNWGPTTGFLPPCLQSQRTIYQSETQVM